MADWASLANGLNAAVLRAFGREVTYQPQTGAAVAVRAILERTHEGEASSPGVYAVLFVRLADLPQVPERGDEFLIDGAVYKVFQVEADGAGGITVGMRAA